ncbi:hypothetical protein QAD02_001683 [Eretmocerus hayati]|uniref:Uncharacterized protein n=1 Tax=Eretmocerus hayati TaxID=131215 RepID=A0ACC2NH33_9HYME|nr:hypothetical protein QAD02_001683 [Eretmocerus hayati]
MVIRFPSKIRCHSSLYLKAHFKWPLASQMLFFPSEQFLVENFRYASEFFSNSENANVHCGAMEGGDEKLIGVSKAPENGVHAECAELAVTGLDKKAALKQEVQDIIAATRES